MDSPKKNLRALEALDPEQVKSFLPRDGGQRAYKAQGLAHLMPRLTRKVAGKRPTLISDLKTNWPHIVGHELAQFTRPARLAAGTLQIDMALGAGPIIALRQADLLAKVQLHLGITSVVRLSLKQADFPLIAVQKPVSETSEALTPAAKADKAAPTLQDALANLKHQLDRARAS